MNEYKSITTPDVLHTAENAVVEICLLKQHGAMPEYPWRKSGGYQNPWQKALSLLRRLKKIKNLSAAEVLYICNRYDISLSWDKIGLIIWHSQNKYLEEEDINKLIDSLVKTHGNKKLETKKKVGRRSMLRNRSK